jgi:subtilisin family serine protease
MADLFGTVIGTSRRRRSRWGTGVVVAVVPAVAAALAATATPAAADGAPAQPVIVRLQPGSDPDAQARAAAARGARVTFVYHDVFPGYAAVLPPGGLRGVEGGPGIVAIDPDTPVRLSDAVAPGAAQAGPSWGLDRIDQHALPLSASYTPPAAGRDGRGVTAYVIDSGIAADHRDLGGRVRSGFSAVRDGRGTRDCAGHGTHVAGTIGGAARGVASAVSLVAVRTLDCDGSGETSGVVAGMDWVARDHRAGTPAVANLSLAGEASDSVDAAVRALVADGVTVAVAAGNENEDACTSSPSREPVALTVAATSRDDRRASFSNRGKCVDLFAPGVDIVSDWDSGPTSTKKLSGTSMATPHVAGAAALLLGAEPRLTPAQVAARLLGAATTGVVRGGRGGDPDKLLYVGSGVPAGTDSSPRSTPAPVAAPASAALRATVRAPGTGSRAGGVVPSAVASSTAASPATG